MPYHWPKDTDFALWELDVLDRTCSVCGRTMYICDHRYRHFHTLEGPVELVCKLNHCPDRTCPGHGHTVSPELEITIALPKWAIGWDVLCWIGHRRCSRHWAISQIQGELWDAYGIKLSEDSLTRYARQYQTMLAARQQDPAALRRHYAASKELILSIDGLQPEKGHETLYVVRELTQKRVWFAEPLLSATADEVRRLLARAKEWAAALDKPVALWLSDRQDAFVTGIAAEFPGVPHRYCGNHFLRDVAKPVLEADSHAKVTMRKKVRGLRKIEQAVLKHEKVEASAAESIAQAKLANENAASTLTETATVVESPCSASSPAASSTAAASTAAASTAAASTAAASTAAASTAAANTAAANTAAANTAAANTAAANIVLEYCAAVRGILNDDQGGPLHPAGLRMAEALGEVRESIQRNLDEKKGGSQRNNSGVWRAASTAAWTASARSKKRCVATSRTSRR